MFDGRLDESRQPPSSPAAAAAFLAAGCDGERISGQTHTLPPPPPPPSPALGMTKRRECEEERRRRRMRTEYWPSSSSSSSSTPPFLTCGLAINVTEGRTSIIRTAVRAVGLSAECGETKQNSVYFIGRLLCHRGHVADWTYEYDPYSLYLGCGLGVASPRHSRIAASRGGSFISCPA